MPPCLPDMLGLNTTCKYFLNYGYNQLTPRKAGSAGLAMPPAQFAESDLGAQRFREAHEGEVVVPAEGLCEARWAQQFSWVGAGMLIWSPVTVSYEVVVVPPQHLAHARVRQLLQIARHGTVAELQAALENTPPSDSDEAFPRPFRDRPFLHRSCTVPGPFL